MARIDSLYRIGIKNVVKLIKDKYWFSATEAGFNPFDRYPAEIVHNLIAEVIDDDNNHGYLNVTYLHPLLTSSCMRELVISDVQLNCEVLENIFTFLLSSCENIIKLILLDCERDFYDAEIHSHPALENLILRSKNLKYIESSIPFDLQVVSNARKLEILILHFPIPGFKGIENAQLPKDSLRYFEISESDSVSFKMPTIPLQYFELLNYSNCCLNDAFECLYVYILRKKPPLSEFKLQYCVLGKENKKTYASSLAISTASMTCPNLKAITIFANDPDGLENLSNFHKLQKLDITFEELDNISVIYDVLENSEFGSNIKSLSISNVINFDLSAIANSCPNLTVLKLDFCNGSNSRALPPNAFGYLRSLELKMLDERIVEDSLFTMLTKAVMLRSLKLSYIPKFNNKIFENVLKINPFNYLSTLHLIHTSATEDGILKFEGKLNLISFRWSAGGQ